MKSLVEYRCVNFVIKVFENWVGVIIEVMLLVENSDFFE